MNMGNFETDNGKCFGRVDPTTSLFDAIEFLAEVHGVSEEMVMLQLTAKLKKIAIAEDLRKHL